MPQTLDLPESAQQIEIRGVERGLRVHRADLLFEICCQGLGSLRNRQAGYMSRKNLYVDGQSRDNASESLRSYAQRINLRK